LPELTVGNAKGPKLLSRRVASKDDDGPVRRGIRHSCGRLGMRARSAQRRRSRPAFIIVMIMKLLSVARAGLPGFGGVAGGPEWTIIIQTTEPVLK
jgi:hypothetical protein